MLFKVSPLLVFWLHLTPQILLPLEAFLPGSLCYTIISWTILSLSPDFLPWRGARWSWFGRSETSFCGEFGPCGDFSSCLSDWGVFLASNRWKGKGRQEQELIFQDPQSSPNDKGLLCQNENSTTLLKNTGWESSWPFTHCFWTPTLEHFASTGLQSPLGTPDLQVISPTLSLLSRALKPIAAPSLLLMGYLDEGPPEAW